jgi:hypothetical protein
MPPRPAGTRGAPLAARHVGSGLPSARRLLRSEITTLVGSADSLTRATGMGPNRYPRATTSRTPPARARTYRAGDWSAQSQVALVVGGRPPTSYPGPARAAVSSAARHRTAATHALAGWLRARPPASHGRLPYICRRCRNARRLPVYVVVFTTFTCAVESSPVLRSVPLCAATTCRGLVVATHTPHVRTRTRTGSRFFSSSV